MKSAVAPTVMTDTESARAAPDFDTIYRRHYFDVVAWVRALGGPDMDAEDLAQDVFVVVHKKLAAYEDQNLKGWLYAIAANLVSDRRRGSWFRRLFLRPRDVVLDRFAEAGDDPHQSLERKDAQRVFHLLANEIHPSRREAFLLFELADMSGPEIAALQGIPVATVWTRLHLARKEFTQAVADHRAEVTP